MKRLFAFVFLFLAGWPGLAAQPRSSSLLWEISGSGLEHPSYLFGTFHLMCKEDFQISEILASKLKECKQFYGELKIDDPGLQMKLMSGLGMQGKTLQSLLPEADFAKMNTAFLSITGYPLMSFNKYKPFLCLSMLVLKSISCKDIVQPETVFADFAKKINLPILGLETVEDQISAIDSQPLDSQAVSLQRTILNFDSVKNVMQQMTAVYKLRDVDTLYAFMKSAGADAGFENELLNKRNQRWVPLVQDIITKDPAFFAVGAGHLGGPNGVISLLRRKGYRLTPVQF